MSNQLQIDMRTPRLRRQMLTFAGGETEAANTKICFPHAEFPQGISVNVVSNESTPFLIGLDVLREYSHILKRYLPCAILPTGHLALQILPCNREQGQHPVASHALSTIFMTRSQNSSTVTLPRAMTIC